MAISNYPPSGAGEYSKVIYVAPSSSSSTVTFSSLRKGIYKPIGVASFTATTTPETGMEPLSVSFQNMENAGFTDGFILDASGNQLTKNPYSSIDYDTHAEGYASSSTNKYNIIVPNDGGSIVLKMTTYRPVVDLFPAGPQGSAYWNRLPLLLGNTMVTFIRNKTVPTSGLSSGIFANVYYFGTNTTTFTTTIPSPTGVSIISGSGFTNGFVCDVVYAGAETNKWVAVGAWAGNSSWSDTRPFIYSSTNGVTWTSRTTPTGNIQDASNVYSANFNVIYSGGSYYASGVILSTTTPSAVYQNRIYTSTDGVTWSTTYYINGVGYGPIYDLCSAPAITEKFAFYNSSAGYVYTSSDAINWTSRPSVVTLGYYSMSAANNIYFVFHYDGNNEFQLTTSTNGTTWSAATLKYCTESNFGPMNYDAGYYWASGYSGILVSTNGTVFEFFPAKGLDDLQYEAGDSSLYYPTGYQPAHDGTRYGWVRTPRPSSTSTPETSHLYYSTGTTAEYLYGKTHPNRQYMFAISEPSAYPTSL